MKLKTLFILSFILLLSGCSKETILVDDVEYEILQEGEYQLLITTNPLGEDHHDYITMPLIDDQTCYYPSSYLYQQYRVLYQDQIYTIIDAITQGIIEEVDVFDLPDISCITHDYANDGILYDFVYQGSDYTLVVQRCRADWGTDDVITIGTKDGFEFYFSSGTIYYEYKIVYNDTYYNILEAIDSNLIDLDDVIAWKLEDMSYYEMDCTDTCRSGFMSDYE